MKGGFRLYGLRREKLSLILVVIMSTTILILSWEKTPSLTGLIPPYPEMLLPSDIFPSWLDEDAEDLLEDGEINGVPILSSLTKSQTKKNGVEEEKTLEEVEYRTDFVIDSPENGPLINGDANIGNNAAEIEEIIPSLSDEEAKDLLEDGEVHGIPALSGQTKTKAKTNEENGEKTSKLEKQGTDFVMDSPENGSLIRGGDSKNGNNATKNEEILSSLSDEEAKDLLEDGESHSVPTLSSQAKAEAKGNEPDDEKTLKNEQRTEFIMDSPQDRSLISLEDANNGNNENEDILPSWSDEDAEDLLENGEINGVPILSSLTKSQTKKNGVEEEKASEEVEYRTDFVIDSPENGPLINGDANIGNNAAEIEEIIPSLSDEEAKDLLEDGEVHGIPALSGQTKTKAKANEENGEKTSKLEKQGTDFVMDSPENGSLIRGGDSKNGNNATKNEEILSSLSDEEAKDLLEDGQSHSVPTLSSQAKAEAKGNEPDDEKTLKNEQRTEFVMDSPQDRSLISLEDANNGSNENEEILSSLSDEEAKDLLEDGETHGSSTLSSLTNIDTADGNRSTIREKDANNWNDATENEVCNYAKGKWVPDNLRPLYSGFGCKRWLSGMWACRLTQRTDFEYENLRWQPKDCQMEEFEGSKFLRRLQNKTLAFVGDSLGRQQFQSLMCMITGDDEEQHDVEDVGNVYGLVTPEGASHPHGWAFRFLSTNTTILYYWSSTLCDTEPIDANNPETGYAMHLDRPTPFLKEYLHKFDVLVLNTGHHWNRGKLKAHRWVMHIGGVPVPSTDKKLGVIWRAKNITVHSVVGWVNSQLPKYPGLKVFYRTISPRHFVGGDWDTGGSCNNTKPMSVGKEILIEEPIDRTAATAVKGTRVKLLDITALSQLRDEGHISRFRITTNPGVQDCLHWCLPGVPDAWNEILFAQI